MIDIRTGKKVNEKAVRFSDEDSPLSYLAQMYDDDGNIVVGLFAGDGDCVATVEDMDSAGHLVNALIHAIDNGFWEG